MTIDKEKLKALAWHTEDHLADKSATTYDAEVAARWAEKGWPLYPLFDQEQVDVLLAEIDQLKAENEALRKDAERYRWLRQASATDGEHTHGVCIDLWENGCGFEVTLEEADAAVDTAMAKEVSHG